MSDDAVSRARPAVSAFAAAAPTPGASVATPPTGRIAALDGLRGFALVGMLLWHAEVGWVQGGFARMTIFFALSGYLGTRTWQRISSRPDVGFRSFWWRRARRLLPMAFAGVGFAVAVTALTGTASMRSRLLGDVVSVLAYASNIRFWQSDQSYGHLFTEPSLLQHYWTLSIEEQSVIVLPLLLAGVGLVVGARPRRAAVLVAVVAIAGAAFPAVVDHTPDAVWYSSIVRFGEFSAGAALALWTTGREGQRPARGLAAAGGVALATLAVVMVTIPREAAWLYQGGMAVFVVPTLVCLAACARSLGPAARILELAPLRLLGRWTLSVYVLHWPLFWLLDATRTGLHGWQLATVRMGAAVALGGLVHVLVERPLMATGPRSDHGRPLDRWLVRHVPTGWWRTRPAASALATVAVAVLAGAALSTQEADYDFDAARRDVGDLAPGGSGEDASAVGVFGGSVALMLALGSTDWVERQPDVVHGGIWTELGCGLVTEGVRREHVDPRSGEPVYRPPPDACAGWVDQWPALASSTDIAVVVPGTWDSVDFIIDDQLLAIGDGTFDAIVVDHLEAVVHGLTGGGARHILFTTTPITGTGAEWELRGLDDRLAENVALFNELLGSVASGHDHVSVVDLAGWVADMSEDAMEALLPDGIHPTIESAGSIWDEVLGPAVLALR